MYTLHMRTTTYSSLCTCVCSYCAEVTAPNEEYTTNWPEGAEERALVVCSPNRAFYIVCESVEERE